MSRVFAERKGLHDPDYVSAGDGEIVLEEGLYWFRTEIAESYVDRKGPGATLGTDGANVQTGWRIDPGDPVLELEVLQRMVLTYHVEPGGRLRYVRR